MSLRHLLLDQLRSRLAGEPLPLRLRFWDGDCFDFGAAPAVTISVNEPKIAKMLMRGDFAQLGEAYVRGELTVEGPIEEIIKTGVALAERVGKLRTVGWAARLAAIFRKRHSRGQDAADVSYHYDVSNDFYRLWLDENMVYSCAYFRDGSEDIHLAQRQKLDHICRKLLLKPGERLLDIGCGWGGLLRWAVRNYGVTGVGVTLSERQVEYARERLAVEGLGDKIEIRLQDYRDIPGDAAFDKIVSVGMYEHVGAEKYPVYFGRVAALLRPGGVMLNHGIIATDAHGRAQGPPGGSFIDRYVFPGGSVPALSRVVFEMTRARLELADIEDLRPHYARTLLAWVRRLESREDEAIAAAGAARYRIWRAYLAGMAYAFDRGWLSVAQLQAFKPEAARPAARPWTREYQYGGSQPVRLAGPLDWKSAPD